MSALSYDALGALLILLPGFLTAALVRMLATRSEATEFDKVVEAFLHSFLVYVCFVALGGSFPVSVRQESTESVQRYFLDLHFWPLFELLVIAWVVAVMFATMINHDFPLTVLSKCGVTQRSFQTSVWNDSFRRFYGYVQVELADGRQVVGWLKFYSDTPHESALYLEDAAWIGPDGKEITVNGPGILFTKASGIRNVMFLNSVITEPRSRQE